MRKEKFTEGSFFHVFNKSIANYGIFKDFNNANRFLQTLHYYNNSVVVDSFSKSIRDKKYLYSNILHPQNNALVKYICFCIMPDHYHLLVKVLKDNTFSKFINDIENSFTRYFNIKFDRKGPLWQSDFKAVRIRNNEQLLHISRYIHLNPSTSYLVDMPEEWYFSSYRDYINEKSILQEMMREISISDKIHYRQFVEDQIDYQRKLKHIKRLLID